MSLIQFRDLSFTYPGSYTPVFTNAGADLDSEWRLGLVGRNGRGKTTLLYLLCGQLKGTGTIEKQVTMDYFPYDMETGMDALHCMRNAIAPFDAWAQEMDALIAGGSEADLERWGELQQLFANHDGYQIDELIMREADRLEIDPVELSRPIETFSPGEVTRLKIAAMFLRRNPFPLIDEPTNHLDSEGRRVVARYLKKRPGFILVSHDRRFLDETVDHIMALNKKGIRIEQGNYSSYRENKRLRDEFEIEQNARLVTEIGRLEQTGREKAEWSDKVEATKIGAHSADRGRVGHLAAKAMKRSLAIRTRIDRKIEEKKELLHDLEYASPLSLHPLEHPARVLMRLHEVSAGYDERTVIDRLTLDIVQGDRIAIVGPNGAGKSTLLKLLIGELKPTAGRVSKVGDLKIAYLPQLTDQLRGSPRELAAAEGLDLSYYLMLLRKLDFPREAFERDMRDYSMGQRKKVLLAACLAQSAHLYVWDEPLNYIDLESREQVEEMLARSEATMVFVEHDAMFAERIATKTVRLGSAAIL